MGDRDDTEEWTSLHLPLQFGNKGLQRKRKRTTVISQPQPVGQIENVNQMVLMYPYSHRPCETIRQDLFEIMPEARIVFHGLWPSIRHMENGRIKIKPILSDYEAYIGNVPFGVPSTGRNRILEADHHRIGTYWVPLSEGVDVPDFLDYEYYKHIQHHFLNQDQNIWTVTLNILEPFVNEESENSLMRYILDHGYEVGGTYPCLPFENLLDNYFGATVRTVYGRNPNRDRVWSDVRLLYNEKMTALIPFNGTFGRPSSVDDQFLLEDIANRDDLPPIP